MVGEVRVVKWYVGRSAGEWYVNSPEEVRHGHVPYALMNIPRTKNRQCNNWKRCVAKIMMGLVFFCDA